MVAVPTPAAFKARYPEFTGVADSLVAALIAEAHPMVDDTWVVGDQQPAILALVAHLLSMEGYPNRPADSLPPGAGRDVISRKVGDVSVQYGRQSKSSTMSTLGLSVYGRRFSQLLKLNAPAIGLT